MDREQETLADILGVIHCVGDTASQGVNKLTKHKSDKPCTDQYLEVENEFIFANYTNLLLDAKPKFTIKKEKEPVLKDINQNHENVSIKEKKIISNICSLCEIKFYKVKELRKHMATIHSDFEPFICDICGKAFKQKSKLKLHGKVHHPTSSDTESETLPCNIKSFICDTCGETFKQKGQLNVHGKVHDLNTSDMESKTFPCTLCPRTVASKYILRKHINFIHGNIKFAPCTKCGKELRQFSVKKHEKLCQLSEEQKEEKKSKEKVACNICGKIYSSGVRMRRHIRFIHNLEKCLQCKHCGYEINRMDYMKAHIKNEHGKTDNINDSITTLVEAK